MYQRQQHNKKGEIVSTCGHLHKTIAQVRRCDYPFPAYRKDGSELSAAERKALADSIIASKPPVAGFDMVKCLRERRK